MIHHDLIIVGGGASGLTSAILAKDFGIDVAIIEGTDRIGKKILTTGNGRCNISNVNISKPFNTYYSQNKHFFDDTLGNYSVDDVKMFFYNLGLPIVELQNGKLYPQSLQASSVVDIFRLSLEDRNIPVYTDCKVKTIHKGEFFELSTSNDENKLFTCGKLILACGGNSASKTGSDGTGYSLAKSFGHKIIKPIPGIVQLKLNYNHLKALSGIKFDANIKLIVNDIELRCEFGETLFTDYGISGPPILQLSAHASEAISNRSKVELIVDMMPNLNKDDLSNFIYAHLGIFSHRPICDAFIGIINKKLIPTILKEAGIKSIHTPCSEIDWKITNNLIDILKEWKFTCIDTNGFNSAQVTVGGIDTNDVDPITLESKLVNNLFFCGEILDVHGDCGGFNLQWAWSSGMKVAYSVHN